MQVTVTQTAEEQIRTAPCPKCILCGGEGRSIYQGLKDRLFSAGGSWSLKRCADDRCGLIWLDPMPLTEDLGKAYASYYTHAARGGASDAGRLKRLFWQMERGYWLGRYKYPVSWPLKMLGKILHLFPVRRRDVDSEARYLPPVPGGRLLDVGCGAGEWLLTMRGLGWQVEGLDFDESAVKAASQSGLEVACGGLEQQNYPNERFDAITLNHVIEHVPDPIGTLVECARILKKGGKLVLFTPNGSSLSHKVFKNDWRGLEPPRHLHIFSWESLPALLKRAGFRDISLKPQIARSVIYESLQLRRGRTGPFSGRRNRSSVVFARLFNIAELWISQCVPSVVDCVGAVAVKE